MRPPSRLAGAPVVKWLLILNGLVFLLEILFTPTESGGRPPANALETWGAFTVSETFGKGQLWRLFTFQFLHAGWMHILFNMYGLFLFGPFVERWWRSKPFLGFYLICGVAGALLYALLANTGILPPPRNAPGVDMNMVPLVGASAGIFGILIAVAIIAPEGRIMLLIPPIPMKLRTFAIVFIGIELVILFTNSNNAGGSAGHLGGALMGFLFMKVPVMRNALQRIGSRQVVRGKPVRRARKVRSYERKLRPKSEVSSAEAGEIDRILDKINEEGLHTLTDEERALLQKASDKD